MAGITVSWYDPDPDVEADCSQDFEDPEEAEEFYERLVAAGYDCDIDDLAF